MASYDLRTEPWLPWVRRSGELFWGSPSDLVSRFDDDPVVSLATPRPDFDGALQEFLIGLLAATFLPSDLEEWEARWNNPPSREEFDLALAKLPPAFSLDGDGPRFLQDISVEDLDSAEVWSVESLLISAPGSTLRNAGRRTHVTDLFVKEGAVTKMSRSTAAMALITLQTYAPEGGRGHLTSMRGGGPLTTLVDPSRMTSDRVPLWTKLWANVETLEDLRMRRDGAFPTDASAIFPWLAPTRTSERPRELATMPADAHPLQAYFAIPRRIRLEFDGPGQCGITGRDDSITVVSFRMRPYGVRYTAWKHPLSPYYTDKGEQRPIHGQQGGLSWRDWLSAAFAGKTDSGNDPALSISRFGRRLADIESSVRRFDVHAFGYDTKQNKARGWVESVLPTFSLNDKSKQEFVYNTAEALTQATSNVSLVLSSAIKSGLFSSAEDQKKVETSYASAELWSRTEGRFYEVLDFLVRAEDDLASLNKSVIEHKHSFHAHLKEIALSIFDTWCPAASFEPSELRRRISSRHNLTMTLAGYSKLGTSIFEALEIPIPVQTAKKRTAKRSTQEVKA
jgi:CRISPR system Cascade subunit CasA